MNISILISDLNHPIIPRVEKWCLQTRELGHKINIYSARKDLLGGDILFLISCSEILSDEERKQYKKTLVLHASDLPYGRGWSPHVWSILEGQREITVSLLEANDKVDTGAIWKKQVFSLLGTELFDEINDKLFEAELSLMSFAICNFDSVTPASQPDIQEMHHPRRTPDDSKINIYKPLAEQFDLMRVADPERYPAFFDYRGRRYICRLEAFDDE